MTDIFPGKVTLKVGASDVSNVQITNVKRVRWKRVHKVTPQTVMNTKIPVGWHQSHKWVEGELHVLSEAKAAFMDQAVAYIDEDGNNVVIPYFVATITDADGGVWTAAFTSALITEKEEPYADDEDATWIYRFVATQVSTTGPA